MKLAVKVIQNERGEFSAFCLSLPGCVSRGQTRQEARERLDEAIRGYLAAVGDFVPENLLQSVVES